MTPYWVYLPGLCLRSGISSGEVIGAVDRAVAASSCCCCCCSLFACALVLTIAMSAAKSKILLDVGGVDCSLVRGSSW